MIHIFSLTNGLCRLSIIFVVFFISFINETKFHTDLQETGRGQQMATKWNDY